MNELGEDGLGDACYSSSYNVFERLIQAGVKLNKECLENIVSKGNFELLDRAIRLGADLNAEDDYFKTRIIHIAAQKGSIKMPQILIDNGSDFNAVDKDGNSVLHYACEFASDPQLVEYLVESGFDVSIQNSKKMKPLMMAAKCSNASVVD